MKKALLLMLLIQLLFIKYTVAEKRAILVNRFEAEQITRDHFDQIYPGISDEDKRNILIQVFYYDPNDNPDLYSFYVDLAYNGEPCVSIDIRIDRTTGDIVDYTPWDFAALIMDYKESIKREDLRELVKPIYEDWIASVKARYPEKVKSFLDEYGADSLDYDSIILDCEFVSPYGIGSEDTSTFWNVFIVHELDTDPITHVAFAAGEWASVKIDAKTGDILDTSEYSDMLEIHGRLK